MPESSTQCSVCDREQEPQNLAHGSRGAICRGCVTEGIAATLISTTTVRDGQSAPRSFIQCRICGQSTPPAALYEASKAHSACAKCLTEAYDLLAQVIELPIRRRLSFGESQDRFASVLLARHFDGIPPSEVIATSRTFPSYLRVDLQRVLEELLAGNARNVGLYARSHYETMTYASLLESGHNAVMIAPLSYEEVDVGEATPVRCLRSGLWLANDHDTQFAVLLSEAHQHGRARGWHVELCVPGGTKGEALALSCAGAQPHVRNWVHGADRSAGGLNTCRASSICTWYAVPVRRRWCGWVAGGLTLLFSSAASSRSSSERIVSIALGYSHTCVLLGSGDVRCWGQDQAVAGRVSGKHVGTTKLQHLPTTSISEERPFKSAPAADKRAPCSILERCAAGAATEPTAMGEIGGCRRLLRPSSAISSLAPASSRSLRVRRISVREPSSGPCAALARVGTAS